MSDDDFFMSEDGMDDEGECNLEGSQGREEAEDAFIEEEILAEKIKRSSSFEVLTEDSIIKDSKSMIEEVAQLCGIPTSAVSAALLRHFKWNKEKLIESYLEDPKKTCIEAGMTSFDLEKPFQNANQPYGCLICFEEMPTGKTFSLNCGHRYCKECWRSYLEVKVNEGPRCVYARCPSPKCKAIVHEEAFRNLTNPKTFERYKTFLFRSFVDDSIQIKWCPYPGCTYAVRCERTGRKQPVTCRCGFVWCFRCCDAEIGDHSPVDCTHLEKWLQKASDESENVKWLMANTKRCPKCRSPIEKNGGCMHMTCRISGCSYEFCWLCRGPWSEHGSATGGYYQCNKYDASEAKKDDEKAADVKTELETYMFYFHRYESHKNAGKIADQQRKNCKSRELIILENFQVRSQDTKFLMEAVEQLIKNRRVLQYSYVMGFYLDKSKHAEKNLFEYLQEDLEKYTNHLSELYEQNCEGTSDYHQFMRWKEEVTNYTRVNKKFLENFLEGTSEGLTYQV